VGESYAWRRAPGSGAPPGTVAGRAYTRAMRRWFCVFILLFGFAGDGYAWSTKPRMPVAIERPVDPRDVRSGAIPAGAWWLPS
jgi:hypothetical protein